MLTVIITILVIVLILAVMYLLALKPNKNRKEGMEPYISHYIAHRGLFDNESNSPENSLKAFEKAVEAGFGIEMDVRLTKDNKLVVFHDPDLLRMCGAEGRVIDLTYDQLQEFTLKQSEEKIPLFSQVLKTVDKKIPMLIEIKAEEKAFETSEKLNEELKGYEGEYCIESFNPGALRWYRQHKPEIMRGQLACGYSKQKKKNPFEGFLYTYLMFNWYTKPDFISFNYKHENLFSFRICRDLYKVTTAAWTIKSEDAMKKALKTFDIIIFDSFVPEKKADN